MKKYMFCFGTRPEAIKMASVIKECKDRGHQAIVCISGQHKDMIVPFLEFFDISCDFDFNVMKANQSLSSLTASILTQVEVALDKFQPDMVFVQGDTTTTFTCALGAFYKKIPVAHIEAGLRTGDINSPFPEEANRVLVSKIGSYHFPPTDMSRENLNKEGISKNVVVTGNTSIDALKLTIDKIQEKDLSSNLYKKYSSIDFNKKIILVTAHRRENHGEPLLNICDAIKQISKLDDVEIVFPVHLNPNVRDVVNLKLSGISNINLLDPLDYIDFSWFMSKSAIILTDSGGVQEEGPYFGKPILVLRENTERPEGVEVGASKLVGHNRDLIVDEVSRLLKDNDYYLSFAKVKSPYGNGEASQKIFDYIENI